MPGMEDAASVDDTLYQCSMHPNVVDDEPGQCPICAMDLQPVEAIAEEGIAGRAPVRLSEQQQQLINIRLAPVSTIRAIKTLEAPGIIEHDQSKVFTISAWTSGRIEKLHVAREETYVEKGDVLYEIYSPDLYTAMQEYVSLLDGPLQRESLLESARARLIQLGLRPEQIDKVAESGEAPLTLPIKSPASGIVMMKMVREGEYVEEGDDLYTVADLSELWLIAEVYEADLPFVRRGQSVAATTPAVPGETFLGAVELVNHHIDPKTRTAKIRVVFKNTEQLMKADPESQRHHHKLLPDMWMTARIERDLGQRLAIPREALFDTGRRQYVFIRAEEGVFVPTEIEAGPRIEKLVIVDSGLEEGQLVVTDGTFLLDSESLLKASATGGEREESAMDHEHKESVGPPPIQGLPDAANAALEDFWSAYLELRAALAGDDAAGLAKRFEAVGERAEALKAAALLPAVGKQPYLDSLDAITRLAALPKDADLRAARSQFGELSHGIIEWSKAAPAVATDELFVASCPMWTDSPGRWIQASEQIENPFMGQAMLACGAIEGELSGGGDR